MVNEIITKEELRKISNQIVAMENDLAVYKQIKTYYEQAKARLFEGMQQNGIDKFITENGTQFTLVKGQPDVYEEVTKFNEAKFKEEQPELWEEYQWTTTEYKAGRKGYVRITLPKGEK